MSKRANTASVPLEQPSPKRLRHPSDFIGASIENDSDKFIKAVNALRTEAFKKHFCPGLPNTWELQGSDVMSKQWLEFCFKLIEKTSREDYESSSFGWHPRRKTKEMKEQGMRYIIIEKEDDVHQPMYGFLSFLPTHDSTPSVPVLYIYEIHLHSNARGRGWGKQLVKLAEKFAEDLGVQKIMLTCFVRNEKALGFYRSLDYQTDACSPAEKKTRNGTLKPDHVIMSKQVQGLAERGQVEG